MAIRSVLGRLPNPVKEALKERVYPPMLAEGETAPEWHLQSHNGTWHRLRRQWAIMVFYPGDDTPGCTAQLSEFQAAWPRLQELGAQVYGVNPAEAESHRAFADKVGIGFPLLTDRGAAVARSFRASLSLPTGPRIIRTVYLINPERQIRLGNRGTPSVQAIVRSIEALQQATRDGM